MHENSPRDHIPLHDIYIYLLFFFIHPNSITVVDFSLYNYMGVNNFRVVFSFNSVKSNSDSQSFTVSGAVVNAPPSYPPFARIEYMFVLQVLSSLLYIYPIAVL